MPTQSSTASFTTPSASTCPATASAEPARNHPTRVDRTKRSVSLITSQRGSTPWATSCRNTGRHQIGMPGRLHRNQQLGLREAGVTKPAIESVDILVLARFGQERRQFLPPLVISLHHRCMTADA